MNFQVNAAILGGQAIAYTLIDTPSVCPRCHRSVHPIVVHHAALSGRDLVQSVFRCTHPKCQELFLALYSPSPNGYQLRKVAPWTPAAHTFPDTVAAVSPAFIEIYEQSMRAEVHQLDQLVGVGLRKSLEFLVKDFAASERPDNVELIRKALLAQCIDTYVSDVNVKECAKRAAWLGNDETHYTRRWESKDIEDLKRLVKLTVNWIDNSIMTKHYLAEMEQGKAS